MDVVLICIFKLFFISFVSADTPAVPTHYCFMVSTNPKYQLSEPDLPDRCQVIIIGKYSFDSIEVPPLGEEDENAIKTLVTANRTVYMIFGFYSRDLWKELFDPPNPNTRTARKSEFVTKLIDLGISGVIMDLHIKTLKTYGGQMSKFISDLKAEIPTLKVGIPVVGLFLHDMLEGPDFTLTNDIVDFYIADLFTIGIAFDYKCGNPTIPPPGKNITLKTICETFNASGIDMKKTAGSWDVGAYKGNVMVSISEFCNYPLNTCTEVSLALHDRGSLIQTFFPWLCVRFLDFDDTDDTCGCGKFLATNKIMDGWEKKQVPGCPKIDPA